MERHAATIGVLVGLASSVLAAPGPLYSNGPFITNPTGGTGAIAGLPISQCDGFTIPGQTFIYSTLGIGATVAVNVAASDNFAVPPGGWDVDSITLYAFQSSQTTPTVTQVQINLWTAAPYAADSPPPIPDPLPTPVLATPLVLAAGPGTFVCHRESPSSTSTNRPVFSYTVSLDGLPSSGRLGPGEYWIQWSFVGASSPSANVFTPLVTPRAQAHDFNARLFNSLDGSVSGPRTWFEGREGYVAGVTEGRAYALPFILNGTGPACRADLDDGTGSGVFDGGVDINDLLYFLARYEAGSIAADLDDGTATGTPDGGVDINDLLFFLARYEAGC